MNEAMARVRGLYDEHGPALLRYLRRMTGRAETAEDLLHETFVQAMRGLRQLEQAASPKAWLFSIARHLGINAVQRRRLAVPLSEGMAAAQAAEEDPRLERMRTAIADLPDTQREALQLRLRDELSYEEIAEVLGVPVGTVRSRLHNAVKGLREQLRNED
jgi:RNA polymerase sigma-70 factor, ECF subfamily